MGPSLQASQPFEHALVPSQKQPKAERRRLWAFMVIAGALFVVGKTLIFFHPLAVLSANDEDGPAYDAVSDAFVGSQSDDFNWTQIIPSKELKWTPCYDTFDCARFSVPLDYTDTSVGEAAIALIRSPSRIPPGTEGYKGPILFNPGGPGGSGVQLIWLIAKPLRTIIGDGFDLIGFDPRGVGFTTPTMNPFVSSGEAGMFLFDFVQSLNASSASFGAGYTATQAFGHVAKDRVGDVARYVGTPAVARDMLAVVKAHGEKKLQYWGFSYGTVLGATFAAMFPDNVGRLILDGVVDSENYYSGLWSNNLRDTDKVLFSLYQQCVDAGEECPLYEPTVSQIHTRVASLLDTLRTAPISYYNPTTGAYGAIDYSAVKRTLFMVLYSPQASGPILFRALADLERGETELMWLVSGRAMMQGMIAEACVCPAPRGGEKTAAPDGWEMVFAIACADAEPVVDNLEGLRRAYDEMTRESMFADCWGVRMACAGWKVRAQERFEGSFETNTSYPILFIGNTADPVTPLHNAYKMSSGFHNSIVLTQDSAGHCSLAAPSPCTAKAIRAYFQDGVLPKEGTTCGTVELSELRGGVVAESAAEGVDGSRDEEEQLFAALDELQRKYPVHIPVLPV